MKNLISVIFIVVVFAATNVSAEKNITLECECINLNVADSPFEFSLFINESLEKVTMEYLRGRGGQRKVQNPPARFSAEEIVIRWGRDRTIIFNRTTFELSGVGAGGEVKGSCEIKNTES
jgi:hypothetical protein